MRGKPCTTFIIMRRCISSADVDEEEWDDDDDDDDAVVVVEVRFRLLFDLCNAMKRGDGLVSESE